MTTKTVLDVVTGEETIVPLTTEELAQREADAARDAARIAEQAPIAAAKAAEKNAVLAKLGLTAEEANILLS